MRGSYEKNVCYVQCVGVVVYQKLNISIHMTVRLCRYACQQSVSIFKMQWRLVPWLGVWGELLLVGGACAQILSPNPDQNSNVLEPANLRLTEEGNKSVPVQNLKEYPELLLRETDYGPVMGVNWRKDDNILAFIDIPYGAVEKPFAVSITNVDTLQYISQFSKITGRRRPDRELYYTNNFELFSTLTIRLYLFDVRTCNFVCLISSDRNR